VKPANAVRLYRVRLRARFVQECLAVLGIASGVALLFASQVASSSLQSSVGQLSRGIVGHATLQLLARGPQGFPQNTVARVRQIPGVRVAAPLLEASAQATGPDGSEPVEFVGADASLVELGRTLVNHVALTPFGGVGAVVLPVPLAKAIGVTRFGQEVTFQLGGSTVKAPLYAQLHERQIGALIGSPVAIAPLSFAQEMTGLGDRVSRILVQPAAGAETRVHAALTTLAGNRLNVEPADYDETLFAKAAAASDQSTTLFAVISALVGFLFAFNAMLLTVPQRRRLIADLRRDGYTPATVIALLLLDALVLGLIACVLGLALGEELSLHLFHANPAFLSLAFAVGSQRVVGWQSVALAAGGGMLATIVAVLSPLRDILSRDPLAAIHGPRAGSGTALVGSPPARALAGVACLAGATAILLAAPEAAIPGMALLVAALLLELPIVLSAALALVKRLASTLTSAVPHVASMELNAARRRALAIAATGAVAVFGSVAIQGAHGDLLAGLDRAADAMNASTDVWVSPAGSYNLLMTAPFAPVAQARLARLPGVRAVRLYRSGLLDYGERRVLGVAPPRQAKLKLEGLARAELWRTILLESLLLLSVGCLTGAIFGLYGQQLADRALSNVVNFPVAHSVMALSGLESLALVTATALAILAVPGYIAACVPAALALQD
jgi:putative ABC transport system permease protein